MKKYIYFLMLIIMAMSAFAISNEIYPHQGYQEEFITGTGIFYSGSENLDAQYTGARSLNVGNYTPLVSDLNNDGTNEVVVLDANLIRLFHGRELTIAPGTYSISYTAPQFDMVLHDIDGDDNTEIIFARTSGLQVLADIIKYNGASLTLNRTINLSSGIVCQAGGCDVLIKCGDTDNCVAGITNSYSTSTGTRVYYAFFNSTTATTAHEYHVGLTSGLSCFPKIKSAEYGDYDQDGTPEYIFSFIDGGLTLTNTDYAYLDYVFVNATNFARGEREISSSLGNIVKSGGSDTCHSGVQWVSDSTEVKGGLKSMVTAPFVYDILTGTSSGTALQSVIAYMAERDNIEMKAYNPDSSLLDTFPASGFGDGHLISNIFRVNAFTSGKTGLTNKAVDFCVAGFTETETTSNACGNEYNGDDLTSCASLLCGSKIGFVTQSFIDWDSAEYVLPLTNLYNISTSSNMHNTIAHSGKQNADDDLRNVIWTYGVSSFSEENCEDGTITKPICYIGTDYNITQRNGIVIPVDVEGTGKNDFLISQNAVLWYLDDGFTNSPVADFCTENTTDDTLCTGWTLSPCTTNGAWQINTSVLVTITPKDADTSPSDNVRARAILYYGGVNEQDSNWTGFFSQGTSIPITLTADALTSSATLRLMATDSSNNETIKTYDIPFSVATLGSVNGDCTEGISAGSVPASATNYSLAQLADQVNKPNTADNPIKGALVTINDLSGGGIGLATLWIIIMAVVAYAIWTNESHNYGTDPRGSLGVIAIVEIIMVILGTWLGFFGIGIIILFVILGLLILAMMLRKVITGSGN